jgi:hypothetical protein
VLGVWKEDKHLHWLQKNPDKQPKNLQDKKFVVCLNGGNIHVSTLSVPYWYKVLQRICNVAYTVYL